MAKVSKKSLCGNYFTQKRKNFFGQALILLFFLLSINTLKAEKLDFYFDKSIVFDSKIPSPEQFLGYEIGSRISEHHRINAYLEKLAELSDRAEIIEIGRTHEQRRIRILAVSSPENLSKLETFKAERQKVRGGGTVNTPLIVFLGYSVHGNEASGAEASLLSAYYLVAAQNDFVRKQLADGIYFIDPVRNPDGQERFASWVNYNASVNTINSSPLDREHNEGWPRGRGNHYWFDLNRDWVNIVHPESKARVAFYQTWLPHVQADHHEMGAGSTFFFEPTNPDGNESRFVPQSTYKLNAKFAVNYSKALDKIGSFYYTKEEYDNKNPTFGSTYPDYNGGVGILFEQASSRGIQQTTDNGLLTFGFTLRNQLVTSIATVDAANENRDALFALQKEFFTTGLKNPKAFIVGDLYDEGRLNKFINLLLAHRLDVYENPQDLTADGVKYVKGKSYIIPAGQPNSALTQIIFDDKKDYPDASKLSYGAGFSVAYSTGLSYTVVNSPAKGAKVETPRVKHPASFPRADYAYLIDFRESKSQQLLFRLLEKDIIVKSAFSPFSIATASGEKDFTYGTLLVPVANQPLTSEQLYALLKELSEKENVSVETAQTGLSLNGKNLGSSSFRRISKPKVLLLTGGEVSSNEAGEVWHLFDQKLSYPLVKAEISNFGRIPLHEFNRIVFAGGSYSSLTPQGLQSLRAWLSGGGTLIAINSASRWALNTLLNSENEAPAEAEGGRGGRGRASEAPAAGSLRGGATTGIGSPVSGGATGGGGFVAGGGFAAAAGGRVPTSIFETRIRLNHPLAFGLTNEILPVVRESFPSIPVGRDTASLISSYSAQPLLNGYINPESAKLFNRYTPIAIRNSGGGAVILFGEDPLFRGIWDATERTFINAILLGDRIGGGNRGGF